MLQWFVLCLQLVYRENNDRVVVENRHPLSYLIPTHKGWLQCATSGLHHILSKFLGLGS